MLGLPFPSEFSTEGVGRGAHAFFLDCGTTREEVQVSTVAARVRDIVAPLVDARGLALYDIEHAGGVLRVVVERPGGTVDLDAIAELTRAVSRALDDADPISGRYTLEVTSPGLERALRTADHFRGAIGTAVKVKTHAEVEGDRRVTGTIVAADDDGFVVRSDAGVERRLGYGEVERARTVFEWGPPPRDKDRRKRSPGGAGGSRRASDRPPASRTTGRASATSEAGDT
jgi:ribosome maturation factor RimP